MQFLILNISNWFSWHQPTVKRIEKRCVSWGEGRQTNMGEIRKSIFRLKINTNPKASQNECNLANVYTLHIKNIFLTFSSHEGKWNLVGKVQCKESISLLSPSLSLCLPLYKYIAEALWWDRWPRMVKYGRTRMQVGLRWAFVIISNQLEAY